VPNNSRGLAQVSIPSPEGAIHPALRDQASGLGHQGNPLFGRQALKGGAKRISMPQSLSKLYVHLVFSTRHRKVASFDPAFLTIHKSFPRKRESSS
jgi:hypothetical protein